MIPAETTEADFVEQLLLLTTEGKPFIPSVYSLLDQLTAEEIARTGTRFACHAGCSFCCNQMVTCTEIEWQVIQNYILGSMPHRVQSALYRRAKRILPEWRRWLVRNQVKSMRDPALVYKDWIDKPCVFLDEQGQCCIYPARTIDCRSVSSEVVCTTFSGQQGGHRFAFPWYQWANNLIIDEQVSKGMVGVTPLIHLLDVLMGMMGKR